MKDLHTFYSILIFVRSCRILLIYGLFLWSPHCFSRGMMASRTEGVYPEIDTRCLCLLSVTRRVLHTCSGGWILRTATVWIIDFGVGIHGALMNRWLKETCVVKLVSPAQMFKATCYSEQSVHTGCPRRNGQNFGRVFLMLKYTDITQHTYIQSWTVTEIKTREKRGLFAVPRTVPGSRDVIPIRCALSVLDLQLAQARSSLRLHM